jgi:NADH-quinone oxidoreductase subunit A
VSSSWARRLTSGDQMLSDYLPIVLLFAIAGAMVLLILILSSVLGPKNVTETKVTPFEGGSEPFGDTRRRFPVKFYVVAILFILFDVEAIFVVPWAVLFQELGVVGFIEMLVFIGILGVGLAYVWRKGALEWL